MHTREQNSKHVFTVEEKRRYYSDRINDVRLSAGQRRFAEMRLNELGGDSAQISSPVKTAAPTRPTSSGKTTQAGCKTPCFLEAKTQLDEAIEYHSSRNDDFSIGYVSGVSMYDAYRKYGNLGADPKAVRELRESIKKEQDGKRELAMRDLLSKDKDPLGIKNSYIVEARGYVKGMSDASKARKGILIK